MYSKRRKTATLRKNQRKRSNRGRRLHRMKMRGGVFPYDKVPLANFNGIENVRPLSVFRDDNNPITSCYISSHQLLARKSNLIKLKDIYDRLHDTKTTLYDRKSFYSFIIKNIKTNVVFSSYTYTNINNYEHIEIHRTPILPIIEEYLYTGFTLEQLLRAELEYITIDAILLVRVPNIDEIKDSDEFSQQSERQKKITEITANVLSDGYDVNALTELVMPPVKTWTESDNIKLRGYIKKDIFNKLRRDTQPYISPAQFIKMGFSKGYLADKGITESGDDFSDKHTTYTLQDLKTYGSLSITELKNAGFTEEEYAMKLKHAGFTATDFRKSKYTLKQLIDLKFTQDSFIGDEFSFDDTDFQVKDGFDAKTLNSYGFDAKSIFNSKMNSHTNIYVLERKIPHIIDINKYLKSIGVKADDLHIVNQEFVKLNHEHELTDKLLLSILILAGFTYNDIYPRVTNNNNLILEAIKHIFVSHQMHQNIASTSTRPSITLHDIGFSASELKMIGFTTSELKTGGFSARTLIDAEFTVRELIDGQFSINDFKDEGFKANELKDDGLTAKDFERGGFSIKELMDAGFTARELMDGQFSTKDFKADGFTAKELKDAGFTAKELRDPVTTKVGFNETFTLLELIDLREIRTDTDGYISKDTNLTGYTLKELQDAGYDLLTNENYDLNYIFKTRRYTYGEIKDAHKYYKDVTDAQRSTLSDEKYKFFEKKLQEILTTLQTNKKKGCVRTAPNVFGRGEVTPLNCVYTVKSM